MKIPPSSSRSRLPRSRYGADFHQSGRLDRGTGLASHLTRHPALEYSPRSALSSSAPGFVYWARSAGAAVREIISKEIP